MEALRIYNLSYDVKFFDSVLSDETGALPKLKESIDQGMPFIALVNYGAFQDISNLSFFGSSFILVVGYDEGNVFVHDVNQTQPGLSSGAHPGEYFKIPQNIFLESWNSFEANQNPNLFGIYPDQPIANKLNVVQLEVENP